jgi:vacuolar-type H+-ATPase subunit C/Vma6
MNPPHDNDLDYLGGLLHARLGIKAERRRPEDLCRSRTVKELARSLWPESEQSTVLEVQRRLTDGLVSEFLDFLPHLNGAEHRLLEWMLVRFQLENLKVMVRGWLNQVPTEHLAPHLVSLPRDLGLHLETVKEAHSLEDFTTLLPPRMLSRLVQNSLALYRNQRGSFFTEAVIDFGYFRELLARTGALSGADRALIEPLVQQEVDTFLLMLVLRGKVHYGLSGELLRPLLRIKNGFGQSRLQAIGSDAEPWTAAARTLGNVLDQPPAALEQPHDSGVVDLASFEQLAWKRFLRLAWRALRCSHTGFAAVVGYLSIRRIEVIDLIRISEAVRAGLSAQETGKRLISHKPQEAACV